MTEFDTSAPAGRPPRRRLGVAAWVAAAAVAATPWAATLYNEHRASIPAPPRDETRGDNGGNVYATQPAVSPDGDRIVFIASGKGAHLYLVDADGTGLRRIANGGSGILGSAFTPDGRQVLYAGRQGEGDFHVRRVGATGDGAKRLGRLGPEAEILQVAFSPDGRRVVYARDPLGCTPSEEKECGARTEVDLYVMDVDGTDRRQLTRLPGREGDPSFSPDGTQVVFTGAAGERSAIFVVGVDGRGLRRVTEAGHYPLDPVFSADGKGIAYLEYVYDPENTRREPRAVALDGSPGKFPTVPREGARATPDWSRFVFTAGPDELEDVYVQDAGTTEARRVTSLVYEPDFLGPVEDTDRTEGDES